MYEFGNDIAIISDFHLKFYDEKFPIVKKFFKDVLANFENIIILGDFFDFFYTFPEVFPEGYLEILLLLKKFSLKKRIIYVEGNHDFNLKNFFNIHVYSEKFFFKFNKKVFLAIHGDTVDKNDKKYRFMRKFFRTSLAKFLMDNLPPYMVLKIAKKLSSSSEKYLRKKQSSKFFKNFFKESEIINENFDILISGHFHINDNFEIGDKKIFLLNGIENRLINYIHLNKKGVELKKWKF